MHRVVCNWSRSIRGMSFGWINDMPRWFKRSDDGVLSPRMPQVDEPQTLAAVFDKARSVAVGAGQFGDAAQRYVVIVTPGRFLMQQLCPQPGSMPEQQVAAIRKMIVPERKHGIAAISYTELAAIRKDISKAIPFIGMLSGLAYVGHAVWVFEGHPSALEHGCRNADILLVDGGMLPFLAPDWQAAASRIMNRPEIYIHDRATFQLRRAAKVLAR